MVKNIQVDERDVPILLELYLSKKKALRENYEIEDRALDNKIGELRDLFSDSILSPPPVPSPPRTTERLVDVDEYPINGKWIDKIKYLVSIMRKATSAQVIDEIIEKETKYKDKRKQVLPTISSIMKDQAMKSDGILKRAKERGDFYYQIRK